MTTTPSLQTKLEIIGVDTDELATILSEFVAAAESVNDLTRTEDQRSTYWERRLQLSKIELLVLLIQTGGLKALEAWEVSMIIAGLHECNELHHNQGISKLVVLMSNEVAIEPN